MLPSALALETLEDVQLRLWGALPTVAGLRASLVETAVPAGPISSTTEGADKETAAVPDVAAAVKSLAVPFDEVRQLAECLFMACHMNPINEDVDSGVQAVLGKPEERSSASFVWDEFVKLIQDIESQWLEWADMKQKWLAVTERQHIKVMQELADAVTQDVEPFLLLPRDKVLTLRSSIVHAKKIDTLFETFVKFAEFRDFPEVYDKLWELLMLLQGGSEGTSGSTPLELGCFTEFFKWFYLPIFANASEEAAAIAARTLWLQHLNAQGVMLKKQFVEACRHMCKLHDVGDGDDVQYFENLYEATVSSIQSADGSSSVAFFGHRRTPSAGRQLIDPNDLYLPEELDPLKQEAELYSADHSENRIIVHGRRGVGKTVLGEAVAKHLRCLHLSVEELAVAAMAKKSEEYTLGAELRKCAEDDAPVSLSLLSALVRERITSEETLYRGYVFSDVPYISKDDSSEGCQFFADCGLFSHFVPTVLVHLDCDDDTHAEYLSRALENAEAQRSEEEKLIEESNEDARRAELRKKIEQLKEEVARQEENKSPDGDPDPSPSEGDGAAAAGESAEDVSKRLQEALNELGPDDQQEEDADARREARDLRIKELRIRRLVRESLSRGYEPEKEVPVVTLPCFQSLQEKLQPLGRCLVLDPASNVDQSAAYIADSLQLNPCVLPQTVAELIGLDVKEAEIIKGDTDEGQTTQESALSAGAVLSGRWKQFCPVTFAETGMLVEGSAVYGCLFRRQLYHLASEEKLVKFKANPPAYVRATPIRRDPILLLSTVEPQNESHLPPDMVAELMRSLCEPLRLTSISFGDYVALWEKHRDLKGRRAQVRDARAKYDKLELKQREERLKKRIIQEQKRLKKLKASAKGKKGRAVPANVVVPEEEYRGWEEVPKEADTIAARIGKTLDEKCRRAKTFVPILVHAMDDIAMDAFEQLFNERVLPETVVVLRYEQPIEENDGDKAGAPPDNETGEGSTTVARPQTKALSMLRGEEGESSSLIGSSAQTFSIHEIIINDKDAGALLTEILQAVSPAMEPVTDGVVDSSLEEVSDEEAEVDDDEDEEDEENMLGVFDQSVRPGRRFLNQFGMTLHYCPVTIHEKGLLMRGQNDLCLEYRRKLYLFRTPDEKAKFQTNPLRYLTFPPHSPPCSVWIVGCSKSGKKTLAKSMGEKYNVPYFCYSRELFEKCIEAAQTPGGATVAGIHIPEQSFSNPYFARARDILKGLREFAEEQQRCMKLRQQAEEEMERRQQAAENDEEDEEEVDEEAEARLQEYLEFEPEDPENRELRLSESYLKIAGCTIHMEPFVSKGYIMVCPPFSGGDMEVLSSVEAIPEVALQIDVSEDIYLPRNLEALAHKRKASPSNTPTMEDGPQKTPEADGVFRKWSEELMRKEREVQKWRRRHIGKDDPESDLEDDNVLDELDNAGQQDNEDLDNTKRLLIVDRVSEEEAITEFAESMEELLVPLVKLNGDLSKNAVFRVATRQLYKVLEHRRSLMYVAEIVRYDDAERMLESGEASLSCFRYTDPVALYDMRHGVRRVYRWIPSDGYMEEAEEEPQDGFAVAAATPADENQPAGGGEVPQTENDSEPSQLHDQEGYEATANEPDFSDEEMSEQDSEIIGEVRRKYEGHRRREWLRHAQRVALFCGRLYFFDTDAALLRYLQDPLLFVQQPPPLPPVNSREVVSVYDEAHPDLQSRNCPVKKRGMAEHVAFNGKRIFISLPKLLSWAAANTQLLSLSLRAIDAVLNGTVDNDLIKKLLVRRLNSADVKSKGAILLNLPRTPEQYKELLQQGLKVDKFFAFDDIYSDATQLMTETAIVRGTVTASRFSVATLTEMCEYIDDFVANEKYMALCRSRGFPVNINNTYHTAETVRANLSPYRWFCAYSWCLDGNLVDQKANPRYGALYLGQYFFFSSEELLQRFLLQPSEIAFPSGSQLLPQTIPVRTDLAAGCALELEGCCPVLLYDTRENRGLRGVLEPVARKGDLKCVVEYDGRYYALLDEGSLERFLMRPWQYIGGAQLPPSRKVPLPEGKTMKSVPEEEFIRRALYDSVAHALIAVAKARPMYLGLSVEESALKYIALHMKSFNSKNTAIQAEQYKNNFEVFDKRSTLYRTLVEAADSPSQNKTFVSLCKEWDAMRVEGDNGVASLVTLHVGGEGVD